MDKETLKQIILQWGIISGFVFLAIIIPLRIYGLKKALEKIKSTLIEGEKIMYILEPKLLLYVFAIAFTGFYWGYYIFSTLFLTLSVKNVNPMNISNLLFLLFWGVGIFIATIDYCLVFKIITNNRIIKFTNFLLLNNYLLKKNIISFSEINHIKYIENSYLDKIIILKKNNKRYRIGCYENLKKVYQYIEKEIAR